MRSSAGLRLTVGVVLLVLQAACATTGGEPPAGSQDAASAVDPRLLAAAEARLAQRRFSEALQHFEDLHKIDPSDVEVRLGLAEARLGAGRLVEAEAAFAELAVETPGRAAVLEGLGIARFRQDDLSGAREALLQALDADERRWRSWHVLAQLHDRAKEWAEADAAYGRALSWAPEPELVHNNWGVSLMARKQHAGAAAEFSKALAIRPDFVTARTNLQLAYAFMGRYEEVLAASSPEDLPRALNNVGYVAMQRGDYEQAGTYFVRALEASPSFYPRAWSNVQRLERLKRAETTH